MSLDIEFFTDEKYEGIIQEPIPAYKAFPKWFSEMKKESRCPFRIKRDNSINLNMDNMKNCPGVTDFLKTGYIIPAWDTFTFRYAGQDNMRIDWFSGIETECTFHASDQFPTLNDDKKPNFNTFYKLTSPWFVKTKPGISLMYTTPWWHRNKFFTSASGIQHTDISASQIQWMFEINNREDFKSDFSFDPDKQVVYEGEPVVLIIPFYRDEFRSAIKYVNEKDWYREKNKTFKSNAISKIKNRGLSDYQKARRYLKNTFR